MTWMYHNFAGRYEFTEGKSNKFWECLLDLDGSYVIRWGRIGTLGQEMAGVDGYEARKRANSKEAKGYSYIEGSQTSVQAQRRQQLEEVLPEAPETIGKKQLGKRRI